MGNFSISSSPGVTHAIGMVNFLFDKPQTPHIGAADLYKKFGVGQSTGQGKSKTIRDYLDMYQSDPNWTLTSKLDNNPMAWLVHRPCYFDGYIFCRADFSPL